MRKALSLFVLAALVSALLAGCSGAPSIAKIGFGHLTDIGDSTASGVDAEGNVTNPRAEVNTIVAAVGFDKAGKVVAVSLDALQSRVSFDADMQIASDIAAPGKSKTELGSAYNMKRVSRIGKEWDEQIQALEQWMIGKTAQEIKGMKVQARDEDRVADVPELTSTVTIAIGDFLDIVSDAWDNAIPVSKATTLGMGTQIDLGNSQGYSVSDGVETPPKAQVDSTVAAVAFDSKGKVVKAIINTCQSTVAYTKEGLLASDQGSGKLCKRELGASYNLKRVSSIDKEWNEQIAELERWMVGKTVEEIKSMKVKERDSEHPAVPDVPELTSLVTITVGDYLAAVEKAKANAVAPSKK